MIFSDPDVAAFVGEHFAAAWESLRPVPTVEIDFGNGVRLKRTITGNVATYVCAPDGRVVDVIAGLVHPRDYLAELRRALALCDAPADDVLAYHRERAARPVTEPCAAMPDALDAEATASLAEASRVNLGVRRPLVHALLSERSVRPGDIGRRLFRDVLELDLDDPWMGLVGEDFDGGAYGHP